VGLKTRRHLYLEHIESPTQGTQLNNQRNWRGEDKDKDKDKDEDKDEEEEIDIKNHRSSHNNNNNNKRVLRNT